VFEVILPEQEIERLCGQCRVIERQRKLHLGMLVRAMVIAAGIPGGAYQADILRSYLELEVSWATRSAFYQRRKKAADGSIATAQNDLGCLIWDDLVVYLQKKHPDEPVLMELETASHRVMRAKLSQLEISHS
jgi:hypothetical protein